MKSNNGIAFRLYTLIAFVIIFIISISSFSWITFRQFSQQSKDKLGKTSEYISLVNEARKAQVDFKIQVQDWKDTLLRGNDSALYDKYYSQFTQDNSNVQSELLSLKNHMVKNGIDISTINSLISSHKDLYDKYTNAIKSYDKSNKNSYHVVDTLVRGIDRQPTDDMNTLVKQIEDKANSETQKMMKRADIESANFVRNLILISAFALVLISFFTIMIISTNRNISRFIEQFKNLMKQAETGDLTISGRVYKKDELGQLTEQFNKFISSIRKLIHEATATSVTVATSSGEIVKTSDEVSKAAEEVAVTVSSLAESALRQAQLADESNKAVVGVAEGLNVIVENTVYMNNLANSAIDTVTSGTSSLKRQRDTMINTKKASENVTEVVSTLAIKSNEIGKVLEFINDITEQINLLSLNASIEAARAGEAGRGFTVVANEVKNLAELSKESTDKIGQLISEVQNEIQKAVNEATNTKASIDEQEMSLKLADDSFNLIQESVFKMTDKVKEVANETKEIRENAVSAERSIKNIVSLIEESASGTEDVASAAEEQTASITEIAASINKLSEMSQGLQNSLGRFKV